MAPTTALQGSCLCEAVKFVVQGDPSTIFTCYCNHCSKNAGAPAQTSAKYKREQVVVISGQDIIRTYVLSDTLSGAPKHKVFCGQCGCTLWTIPMKHGGESLVVRTSLIANGLELLPPKAEFFARNRVDWPEKLQTYDTMPGAK